MSASNPVPQIATELDAFEQFVLRAFELPVVLREVFMLCDVRGFTPSETASLLGISAASVITRLDRARRWINQKVNGASSASLTAKPASTSTGE